MQWVIKQTVASRKGIVLTSKDRSIREHQFFQKLKVVLSDKVTNINRATRDGSRGGMEGGARVGGLKHIPIRVDEVAHPQAIVGTMNHVATL